MLCFSFALQAKQSILLESNSLLFYCEKIKYKMTRNWVCYQWLHSRHIFMLFLVVKNQQSMPRAHDDLNMLPFNFLSNYQHLLLSPPSHQTGHVPTGQSSFSFDMMIWNMYRKYSSYLVSIWEEPCGALEVKAGNEGRWIHVEDL